MEMGRPRREREIERKEGIFLVNIDSLSDGVVMKSVNGITDFFFGWQIEWKNRVIKIIINFYSLLIFVAHLNAELNEKKQKILQKQS